MTPSKSQYKRLKAQRGEGVKPSIDSWAGKKAIKIVKKCGGLPIDIKYLEFGVEISLALQQEREEAAKILELRQSEILLMCGELTAGELRIIKAILLVLATKIRERK